MPRTNLPEPCSGELELWAFPLKFNRNVAPGLGREKHLQPLSSLPWLLKIIVAKNKNILISKGQWGNWCGEPDWAICSPGERAILSWNYHPSLCRNEEISPSAARGTQLGKEEELKKNERGFPDHCKLIRSSHSSSEVRPQRWKCRAISVTQPLQHHKIQIIPLRAQQSPHCIQSRVEIRAEFSSEFSSPSPISGALLRTQPWSAEGAHTGCISNHSRWFLKVCLAQKSGEKKPIQNKGNVWIFFCCCLNKKLS